MQKKILAIAITLPLVLLLGIFCTVFTRGLSNDYQKRVLRIEECVRTEDYLGGQEELSVLSDAWEGKEPLLRIWVCHVETDEVSKHLRGLQVGLLLEDRVTVFEHSAGLIEALEHLHHRDDLTISNVL